MSSSLVLQQARGRIQGAVLLQKENDFYKKLSDTSLLTCILENVCHE